MRFTVASGWLSISVLLVGTTAPVWGHAVNAVGDAGSESLSGMAWDAGCQTSQSETRGGGSAGVSADASGVNAEQSYEGRYCAMASTGEGVLVEATAWSGAGWIQNPRDAGTGMADIGDGGGLKSVSSAPTTSFVADLSAVAPDEIPTRAKVPEPATLALLGAGLITMARVSRIKRQPRSNLRLNGAGLRSARQYLESLV